MLPASSRIPYEDECRKVDKDTCRAGTVMCCASLAIRFRATLQDLSIRAIVSTHSNRDSLQCKSMRGTCLTSKRRARLKLHPIMETAQLLRTSDPGETKCQRQASTVCGF